jgi:hypothetical protein
LIFDCSVNSFRQGDSEQSRIKNLKSKISRVAESL